MKKGILILTVAVVLLTAVTANTFAWLAQKNTVTFPESFGATHASAYFAGGDGSAENPYQISSSVHLYNLAWLQYLGYFNMNPSFNNGRSQNFFVLESDIDLDGMAIPPIGTDEYPFIGRFDGQNHIVSNLVISNSKTDLQQYPTNADFSGQILCNPQKANEVSLVGLFGVVGNYNGYITNGSYGTHSVDSKQMSVNGFYLDSLTVKSESSQTLAGLVAGYVGADVKNTGVWRCRFELAKNTVALDGYESSLSKYSIVGDYNESTVSWKELEGIGGSGSEVGAGGSLSFRDLARRMNYMATAIAQNTTVSGVTGTGYRVSDANDRFHAKLAVTLNQKTTQNEFYWTGEGLPSGNMWYCDLMNGAYLPINVDSSLLDGEETTVTTKDGKSWHSNAAYLAASVETPAKNNTGWLIGGAASDTSSTGHVRVRIQRLNAGSGVPTISGAFSGGISSTYDSSKLQLSAYDPSVGKFVYIADSVNNMAVTSGSSISASAFARYSAIRDQFDDFLGKNGMIYGLRFTHGGSYSVTAQANGSYTNVQTIDGTEYLKRAINFKLDNPMVVTMIAGSYASSSTTTKQSFPAIYDVTRNENGKVTNVQKIAKVYQKGTEYLLEYVEGDSVSSEGYTLVYDRSWYASALEAQKAFYAEIPLPAGDYVISNDHDVSSNSAAYLMYLDIGANGDGEEGADVSYEYSISCVDFVSPQGSGSVLSVPEQTDSLGNYIPAYADVVFNLSKSADSSVLLAFRRENWEEGAEPIQTKVLWYLEGTATVTPLPPDGMSERSDGAKPEAQSSSG